VDSLVRGWPFGTLLLWQVNHDEKRNIPSRAFWPIVDRTDQDSKTCHQQAQAPATYQMVLDGQQRVQSLLLATHGDNGGFRMYDKPWGVEVGSKSVKGKTNKNHWTLGSLCLDLEIFLQSYEQAGQQISALDFEKALVWAVTDEAKGHSTTRTPANYIRPLQKRYTQENRAKLIRFSRLWTLAGINPNFKEKNYSDGIDKLLIEHGMEGQKLSGCRSPLAELLTTLRDVKLQKVAFLQLRPYDGLMSRDSYDDAIVNIFTRLNTAGRTLTREEITFAWLKYGWDEQKTSTHTAQQCFNNLQEDLKGNGLDLHIDTLVAAVSFIWAVAKNGGRVLTNRDLLQGDIIKPMAGELSEMWSTLSTTVSDVTQTVHDRDLFSGRVAGSVNALSVIWAGHFLFLQRALQLSNGILQRDSVNKTSTQLVNKYIDRWLAGSSWAQRWASSGGKALPSYATTLAEDVSAYAEANTIAACTKIFEFRLNSLVQEVLADAENHISSRLGVEERELVSQYFVALWLWHRLDQKRWEASSIPLRIDQRKIDLEVDHIVSVKIWEGKQPPENVLAEDESLGSIINALGNCALLQKSFNIIKSGDSLRTFMNKVHDIINGPERVDGWAQNLGLTADMLDGDKAEFVTLKKDIAARDAQIRSDLVGFLRGDIQRVDIGKVGNA
jgi:hypothetical protein